MVDWNANAPNALGKDAVETLANLTYVSAAIWDTFFKMVRLPAR